MKFLVIQKSSRYRWDFNQPGELALFMWGKDLKKYDVFLRISELPAEVGEMTQKLERLQNAARTLE